MNITKSQINLIRSIAVDTHKNQPVDLYWEDNKLIDEDEKRAISYITAINLVLKLDLTVKCSSRKMK